MSTTTDTDIAARHIIASAEFTNYTPHMGDWLEGFTATFSIDGSTIRIVRAVTPNLDETTVDVLGVNGWQVHTGEYADLTVTRRPNLPPALEVPGVLAHVIDLLEVGASDMHGRILNYMGELADSILTDIADGEA